MLGPIWMTVMFGCTGKRRYRISIDAAKVASLLEISSYPRPRDGSSTSDVDARGRGKLSLTLTLTVTWTATAMWPLKVQYANRSFTATFTSPSPSMSTSTSTTTSTSTFLGTSLVALAAAGWGTWALFLRNHGLPATWQSVMILSIIALAWLPAALAASRRRARRTTAAWALLVACGVTDAGNYICYFGALDRGPIALAVLTHYI